MSLNVVPLLTTLRDRHWARFPENPTNRNIYKWCKAAFWIFTRKRARWRSRALDFSRMHGWESISLNKLRMKSQTLVKVKFLGVFFKFYAVTLSTTSQKMKKMFDFPKFYFKNFNDRQKFLNSYFFWNSDFFKTQSWAFSYSGRNAAMILELYLERL